MSLFRFSTFTFNTDTRQLSSEGQQQYLRKKVADVLTYLLQHRDRVVSKDELLNEVWEQGEFRENSLLQSIRELRKLFGESAQTPQFIRTVHLKGYEWIWDAVTEIQEGLPQAKNSDKTPLRETAKLNEVWRNPKLALLLPIILLLLYLAIKPSSNSNGFVATQGEVAVLPFINDTGEAELQWLELGYSDMFSEGLRKSLTINDVASLNVVPTYHVQGAMAQQKLDKRLSNSEQIASLLDAMEVRYAIVATINKDGKALRFNYRIHDEQGVFATGSIEFPNLPSSLASLVRQVATHLLGTQKAMALQNTLHFANKEAQQDYANGMQALQSKGAKLAKRYFEAALLNDEHSLAARNKLAHTLYLLGEWQQAENLYQSLLESPQVKDDAYLSSDIYNGLANLLFQKHQLQRAETMLQQGLALATVKTMPYRRAQLLRTQSKVRFAQGRYNQRHQLLAQADKLSQPFTSLQNEADALYYLGSPTNIGLEVDPDIDMQANKHKLSTSLSYYQSLGNKTGEARSLLAIGQNYHFSVEYRLASLLKAKHLFEQIGNQFELVDTLSYLGFFYIQFHHGELTAPVIQRALELNASLDAPRRQKRLLFLAAFAQLDQGIDRGQGSNKQKLRLAIEGFSEVTDSFTLTGGGTVDADSKLLSSWAHAELGQYQQALLLLQSSYQVYQQLGYAVSRQYAQVSMMEVYLKLGNWQQVTVLSEFEPPSYLANIYAARSNYELGNFSDAVQQLRQAKFEFAHKWTPQDEQRLAIYVQTADSGHKVELPDEISSHLNYCEDLNGYDFDEAIFTVQRAS